MKTITLTLAFEDELETEVWEAIGKLLAKEGVYKELQAQYLDIKKLEAELPF
jgi:hypothetical protein